MAVVGGARLTVTAGGQWVAWSRDMENETLCPSEQVAYRLPFVGSTARAGKMLARLVPAGAWKTRLAVQVFPRSVLRDTMMWLGVNVLPFSSPVTPDA